MYNYYFLLLVSRISTQPTTTTVFPWQSLVPTLPATSASLSPPLSELSPPLSAPPTTINIPSTVLEMSHKTKVTDEDSENIETSSIDTDHLPATTEDDDDVFESSTVSELTKDNILNINKRRSHSLSSLQTKTDQNPSVKVRKKL